MLLSLHRVTAESNYNSQNQTKIMSKLLCWQKNGCTVVICDHEIKTGNPVPGVLQEAQGKANAMEPHQHIGLNSWAQAHRPKESIREIPTEPPL